MFDVECSMFDVHSRVSPLIRPHSFRAWLVALVLCCFGMVSPVRAELPACVTNQPILFVVRNQYRLDHHNTATFFPSAPNEFNTGYFTPGGGLKVYDPVSGSVETLLVVGPTGVIRDPDVHFSGEKVVFSMRKDHEDSYHIYEINVDGTGLKQLTSIQDADDLDPIYMPDGDIVFTSTREPKYIGCNKHISANLHKMESDGANIQQIARSTLFEDHPSLMPDGRIMYSRWEYVDRNFGDAQGLWTCEPDGTGHAIYYGNNTAQPGGVFDGQVIPGTQRTVCTFGSCHNRPWGAIAIIDRRKGVDGADPVVHTWPADAKTQVSIDGWQIFDHYYYHMPIKYEDPWPLVDPGTGVGGRYFLCARQVTSSAEHTAIYLLDTEGETIKLYDESSGIGGCYDPMPLAPRPVPHDVNVHRKYDGRDGRFYVQDVYEGTHMAGVARGEVKYLRVVEAPNKPYWTLNGWGGQGFQGPGMNWENIQNKKILGTVPVEADGSAHFNAPSSIFLFFQLLDENKMMIQSMRTATIIQPNETQGCIGCHDNRALAPAAFGTNSLPLATMRPPSQLDDDTWYGEPRNFGFLEEVQPVFDAKCVTCHDFGGEGAGKLVLAGDKGLYFNASYTELWRKGYTGAIGAGPAKIQQAKSWGSHASPLMAQILAGHGNPLTPEEFDRIATWLDLNAPYYPHFSSSYPGNLAGRSPLNPSQVSQLSSLTGRNLAGMKNYLSNPGPQVCFDRPEKSPCLTGLTGATYTNALAIIQAGQAALAATPRADMAGHQVSGVDAWRDGKFADRRHREAMNQAALNAGIAAYDAQPLMLTANSGAEGIDGVSALVQGEVIYTVSNSVVDVTVCWGSFDGGDVIGNWQYSAGLPSQSEGDFELVLSGLVPGADVYFRVFVSNSDGTVAAYESTVFDTRSLIDLDGDGMADSWEAEYFGSAAAEGGEAGSDWDGDGLSNVDEYRAGTDPTHAASVLALESVAFPAAETLVLRWQSASNAVYAIDVRTNLLTGTWVPLADGVAGTPPLNVSTTTVGAARHTYYRVRGRRTDR